MLVLSLPFGDFQRLLSPMYDRKDQLGWRWEWAACQSRKASCFFNIWFYLTRAQTAWSKALSRLTLFHRPENPARSGTAPWDSQGTKQLAWAPEKPVYEITKLYLGRAY